MEINNCSNCGGKVEFSPLDKALKCTKCGSIYPLESTTNATKKPVTKAAEDEGFTKWENEERSFQCSNCGAKITLHNLEMTNKCQYCNTFSLVPLEALPGLKPDIILPFRISKDRARQIFQDNISKKWLIPNEFKKKLPKIELGAMYVSGFTFSFDTISIYNGMRSVTSTSSINGKMVTSVHEVPFSGVYNHKFNNVVVEASNKIEQSQINSILPFNFGDSYDYNAGFLKGFTADYYNRPLSQSLNMAKGIAKNEIYSMVKNQYQNVESLSVSTNFGDERYNYALLPVYFINYKYKDKTYLNLMNGQDGKVGGKCPRSKVKISIISTIIGLLVVGVPLLVILLLIL